MGYTNMTNKDKKRKEEEKSCKTLPLWGNSYLVEWMNWIVITHNFATKFRVVGLYQLPQLSKVLQSRESQSKKKF